MKRLARTTLTLAALVSPLSAFAHPGHDDPDFTWDFSHLVEHPFATFICFAVLAGGAGIAWRIARRKSRDQSLRASHLNRGK